MTADFIHKTERPWPNPRLKIAAIIGHTTATTSRVWVRTGQPGEFQLLHFPENDGKSLEWFDANKNAVPFPIGKAPKGVEVSKPFQTTWATDVTHVVDVAGLRPDTKFRYAFHQMQGGSGEERLILGHDKEHAFKTPSDKVDEFRFGLFSCHMPFKAGDQFPKETKYVNMDVWNSMCYAMRRRCNKEGDLDFVIAGGDQCYTDGIPTLDIWRQLDKIMGKDKGGNLLPSLETMVHWYRDIYRGYWGFYPVRRVFSSIPTYMIWDDHEFGDGWGSHKIPGELNEVLPSLKKNGLSDADGANLIGRMGEAAKQVYWEYQHSHNPEAPKGQFDYHFRHKRCEFYVLDGRGHRDISRGSFRVLGEEQFHRFKARVNGLKKGEVDHLFVVSAVPVLHTREFVVNRAEGWTADRLNLTDDLRDAWEHDLHDEERGELMKILFAAANKGIKVAILSGDVHASAAFKISDGDRSVFQLTSSPITYNLSRAMSWLLRFGVPDNGETKDGYGFERLALYTQPSYSAVCVHPGKGGGTTFQIYGKQTVEPLSRPLKGGESGEKKSVREQLWNQDPKEFPVPHSIAKIPLL